jgi:hypothetical protein
MAAQIDFLGIGAPRAGTTWLWTVLKRHPGVWMPPLKELHYFDRSLEYPSPETFAEDRFADRFFGHQTRHALFRRLMLRSVGSAVLIPSRWKDLPWLFRYFLGTCSDDWYLSLFAGRDHAVKGEITPAYSILSEEDIQRVHRLLPEVKLIYLIRNPVERTWSGLRLRWSRRKLDLQNFDQIIHSIEDPLLARRGDYYQTIENWTSVFPSRQLKVCFYDDIAARPLELIAEILGFLQVDDSLPVGQMNVETRINPAKEMDMPAEVRHYLARKYYPEVEKLIPLVQGHSLDWLAQIESML